MTDVIGPCLCPGGVETVACWQRRLRRHFVPLARGPHREAAFRRRRRRRQRQGRARAPQWDAHVPAAAAAAAAAATVAPSIRARSGGERGGGTGESASAIVKVTSRRQAMSSDTQ